MIGIELPAYRVDEVVRVVRALGSHRYVAGRLHLVHAFVFASLPAVAALEEARTWAAGVLQDPAIDASSRDERLWRRSSDAEVAAALEAFWTPGAASEAARQELTDWLERAELPIAEAAPFDESVEEDIHPLLIDAGWELIALASLDPERHKGAIAWFGEPIAFETAVFDEECAIPPVTYLQELPAIGPVELLRGTSEEGELVEPLTLWTEGNEAYHAYLLAGVKRAAKLE